MNTDEKQQQNQTLPAYNGTAEIVGMQAQEVAPLSFDASQVASLASEIKLSDPASVLAYGAKPMGEIARFADTLLTRIRAKDAGEIGEQLSKLVTYIRENDPLSAQEKTGSFLSSLPVVGSLFKRAQKAQIDRQTLAEQVDGIATHLDNSMVNLLRDIETLEQLYAKNYDYYKEVSLYIEAGRQKLEQIKSQDLPALQQQAQASKDMMQAQQVKDLLENINRFERRLHDLELSKIIAVQTAPQIRMVQSNNQQLAEKIQTSILSTLPIWKSQLVLTMTLDAQRKAAQLQKDVSDTTNDLLRKNAQMLEQSSIATATEVERSIVDVETLREVQSKLVNTIEETLRIASEARTKRAEVEKELSTMEENLRQRLTDATAKYR